jgi:hypothetical protein
MYEELCILGCVMRTNNDSVFSWRYPFNGKGRERMKHLSHVEPSTFRTRAYGFHEKLFGQLDDADDR